METREIKNIVADVKLKSIHVIGADITPNFFHFDIQSEASNRLLSGNKISVFDHRSATIIMMQVLLEVLSKQKPDYLSSLDNDVAAALVCQPARISIREIEEQDSPKVFRIHLFETRGLPTVLLSETYWHDCYWSHYEIENNSIWSFESKSSSDISINSELKLVALTDDKKQIIATQYEKKCLY